MSLPSELSYYLIGGGMSRSFNKNICRSSNLFAGFRRMNAFLGYGVRAVYKDMPYHDSTDGDIGLCVLPTGVLLYREELMYDVLSRRAFRLVVSWVRKVSLSTSRNFVTDEGIRFEVRRLDLPEFNIGTLGSTTNSRKFTEYLSSNLKTIES